MRNNLKKLTRGVIVITVTIALCCLLQSNTFAETTTGKSCGVATSIIECEEGGSGTIFHILRLVLEIMGIGVGIFAVIGISVAGIQYLTAGDSTEKATKAKRRIYETVIGIACFVVLWSASEWLLPGGLFNADSAPGKIKVAKQTKSSTGQTFVPDITFQNPDGDRTYSLYSQDDSIVRTLGTTAKCVAAGTAKLLVVASDGNKSETSVTCTAESNADSGGIADDGFTGTRAVDGSPTVGNQSNVKYRGSGSVRPETKTIINKHNKDFNYRNFNERMRRYGGYQAYLKNLGGVFQRLATTSKIPVKTAADFQAASEYVFGLWMIWGPDYGNHNHHVSWNGNDAFYYGLPGRDSNFSYSNSAINTMLRSSSDVRTCCNIAINTLYKSTTLGRQYPVRGPKYTKWTQLKVGDVLQFYQPNGNWAHTAVVGEVYSDYLIIYDGGSRFMMNRNYKMKVPRRNDSTLRSPYDCYGRWYAFRPWNIEQSLTLSGLNN